MKKLKTIILVLTFALILSGCSALNKEEEKTVLENFDTNLIVVDGKDNSSSLDSVAETEEATQDQLIKEEDKEREEIMFATLKTSMGEIKLELFPSDAPNTVRNFVNLSSSGFYEGVTFHRVIPNFMIQGGDPLSKDNNPANDGTGGPGYFFDDEINSHKLVKGSLAMANAGPNTNGSQFFIVTAESTPWLDGNHTVFGKVVSGMEVVEAISLVQKDARDRPIENIVIESVILE